MRYLNTHIAINSELKIYDAASSTTRLVFQDKNKFLAIYELKHVFQYILDYLTNN